MSTRVRRGALAAASLASTALLPFFLLCGSCGSDSAPDPAPPTKPPPVGTQPAPTGTTPCQGAACTPPPVVPPAAPLRMQFIGVSGFLMEYGDDALLTAPLFTRPSLVTTSAGLPVTSDPMLVANGLPSASATAKVRTILTGHAHYDHLLDVPEVMSLIPQATLYSNLSARNLLAAYAPDRDAKCAATAAQPKTIARSRVVAFDDPAASTVDYRNCQGRRPAGAPLEGTWVRIPNTHIRVLAVCSEHPDQFGPVHFGAGDVETEECTPPTNMGLWKEGLPLAYLVDFLDPKTDAPVYRVYYQDAPTNDPVGHIPPSFLADKRVDVALLCVGLYQSVDEGSPAKTIASLDPRFAIGGHWEDFTVATDVPPTPIPFLDVPTWGVKAREALPPSSAIKPFLRNGMPAPDRAVLPTPGDTFEFRQ